MTTPIETLLKMKSDLIQLQQDQAKLLQLERRRSEGRHTHQATRAAREATIRKEWLDIARSRCLWAIYRRDPSNKANARSRTSQGDTCCLESSWKRSHPCACCLQSKAIHDFLVKNFKVR